ncbi:thermonuclease family protein [uncultured Pseudodesulfovibrio sp.]|uniref:thermonuclease family protein n=1 Tax=uncultured Pseudodesulfovibrio sp. TaxID=2035858 RepID=UPI002AAB891C|nr:thermonuclease family protein [uncultured Pseudodesulfovibrio sp.]
MNSRNLLLLLLLLTFFPSQAAALDVQFLRIIDGDSLVVVSGGDSVEVRLIGVDAPEKRQEYSNKAKVFSLKFCHGKRLKLVFDKEKKDHYGRTLAYVYADGEMLNKAIVKAGLALAIKVKPNTRYYAHLKEVEDEARKAKRGFWLFGGLKQTPAQWRRSHK